MPKSISKNLGAHWFYIYMFASNSFVYDTYKNRGQMFRIEELVRNQSYETMLNKSTLLLGYNASPKWSSSIWGLQGEFIPTGEEVIDKLTSICKWMNDLHYI